MLDAAASGRTQSRIILVHGTFAEPRPENPSQRPRWSAPDGRFAGELSARVTSAAGVVPEVEEFRWSGANSEVQRRLAGKLLLNRIEQLEKEGGSYHLIGHSHGGSVIWHALTASMADPARRTGTAAEALPGLRSWATVGTPFLTFGPSKRELFSVALLLAGFLLWLATWSTWILDAGSVIAQAPLILQNAADWANGATSYAWYKPIWREGPIIILGATLGALVFLALKFLGWGLQLRLLAATATPALIAFAVALGVVLASWQVPFVAALHERIAGKIGLVVLALLIATVVLVVSFLVASLVVQLLNWWDRQQRRLRAQAACAAYGARWYSLVHRQDEAASALVASLLPAPAIRPIQRDTHGILNDKVLHAITRQFTRARDEAIWEGLTQKVQGDDMSGYVIRRVGLAPVAFRQVWPPLSGSTDASMMALANAAAGAFAAQLRDRFSTSGKDGGHDTIDQIVKDLSFGGLVHNSYFFDDEARTAVRRDIVGWLAAHVVRSMPEAGDPAAPRPPLHGEWRDVSAALSDFRLASESRFRAITIARATALAVAFGALMLATTAAFETSVRPLTREAQVAETIASWKLSGAFATADAPMVGAFVVRLAVAGELSSAEAVRAVFRTILERNARAVAGQRLAFAWGRDGALEPGQRDRLVRQVRTEILGQDPADPKPPREAHLARANHLVTLHLLAGIVARHGRLDAAQLNDANAAWTALSQMCRDVDLDAVAHVYLPVLVAGGGETDAADVLRRVAIRRGGQCGQPEVTAPSEADLAWQQAFLLDRALDAVSWNQPALAGKLLALAGGDASEPGPLLAALDRTRDGARKLCTDQMRNMAELIGAAPLPHRAPHCSLEQVQAAPANWVEQDGCAAQRQISAKKLSDYRRDGSRLRSLHADLDDAMMNSYRFCRVEPAFTSGNLRACATQLAARCEEAGDAAQRPIDLALVLVGMSRFADALKIIQPIFQGSSLWLDDAGDVPLVGLFEAAYPAPRDEPPLGRERQMLVDAIVAQQMRLAEGCRAAAGVQPRERPCARNRTRRAIHLRSAAFMRWEVKQKTEARQMVADLVADIDRRHAGDQGARPSRRELLAAADAALIVGLRDQSGRMIRFLRTEIRRMGLGAIETASDQTAPFTAAHIRLMVNIMTALQDPDIAGATATLAALRDQEYTRDTRAALARQLAGIRAGLGDFFLANKEATGAVAANEVLAGRCMILDNHIEQNDGLRAIKERYGLEDHRRWPQPAPAYFHTHARFAYDGAASRPLACRTGPSYDLD